MMRGSATFAVIVAVSILIGITQAVAVVGANPGPVVYPSVPNTDLPTLTINNPETPVSLSDNATVSLNVTVIPPGSWASKGFWIYPTVGSCGGYIYLDGIVKSHLMQPHDTILFTGYPNSTLKISVSKARECNFTGTHSIRIDVTSYTYSQIGTYSCNISQSVNFTVDPDSQKISFSESPVQTVKGTYPTATPSELLTPSPKPSLTLITSSSDN